MPHSYPEYGAPEIDPGNNDMSGTPPSGGQSSRPTPNSSTASETLSNLTPGGNTFETTSPPTSLKNLMNMPGTTTQGEMGANNAGFNFNDPPFVLGSGVSEYPVPSGWGGAGDMSVQAGMTPGTERMLQSMMAGSIDAMDMGWDPNT